MQDKNEVPKAILDLPQAKQNPEIETKTSLFEPRLKEILTKKETGFYNKNYEGYEVRENILNSVNGPKGTITSFIVSSRDKELKELGKDLIAFLETKITPENWEGKFTFKPLEGYKYKFSLNDIIRQQYINIALVHNFFGYLPKTITIKVTDEKHHELAKPLEKSNIYIPKPDSKEVFLKSDFGGSIKVICDDFGLDIIKIAYIPFETEAPVVVPGAPHLETLKSSKVNNKEGKGKLIITTALVSNSQSRLRY